MTNEKKIKKAPVCGILSILPQILAMLIAMYIQHNSWGGSFHPSLALVAQYITGFGAASLVGFILAGVAFFRKERFWGLPAAGVLLALIPVFILLQTLVNG